MTVLMQVAKFAAVGYAARDLYRSIISDTIGKLFPLAQDIEGHQDELRPV